MASETAKATDQMAAMVYGGGNNVEACHAPRFLAQFENWGKNEAGEIVKLWEVPFSNAVQNQGRAHISIASLRAIPGLPPVC